MIFRIPAAILPAASTPLLHMASAAGSKLPPGSSMGTGGAGWGGSGDSQDDNGGKVRKSTPLFEQTARDRLTAEFHQKYFDIASREYDAFAPELQKSMAAQAQKKRGDIHVLDVGCGQGHLMERVLGSMTANMADRFVLHCLDPNQTSLEKYRQRLSRYRMGNVYHQRLEGFRSDPASKDTRFDVVFAFQSLYSFDLAIHENALATFTNLLTPQGVAIIGQSHAWAAYFTLLKGLGPLFHEKVPTLNTAEDIETALNRLGLSPKKQTIPFKQEFNRDMTETLQIYVAAVLYLAAVQPILVHWASVEAYLNQHHLSDTGDKYEFQQDIAFITLGKDN